MLHISAEFLSLSGEPAVLVKQDRIVFVNSAAESILGSGCIGRSPGMVFGAALAGTNCPSFICDIMIDGVGYIARATSADNMKAIFFSRREFPAALLSDAFVYSIRNRLMSFAVAADIGQVAAAADCLHRRKEHHHGFRADALPVRVDGTAVGAGVLVPDLLAVAAVMLGTVAA